MEQTWKQICEMTDNHLPEGITAKTLVDRFRDAWINSSMRHHSPKEGQFQDAMKAGSFSILRVIPNDYFGDCYRAWMDDYHIGGCRCKSRPEGTWVGYCGVVKKEGDSIEDYIIIRTGSDKTISLGYTANEPEDVLVFCGASVEG